MNLEKHPVPTRMDAVKSEGETLEITWIRSRF